MSRKEAIFPYQMIFRNRVAKMKLVKQLILVTLQTAHHGKALSWQGCELARPLCRKL